eukprot:1180444-Prorocentrum_minimum.AAC.5
MVLVSVPGFLDDARPPPTDPLGDASRGARLVRSPGEAGQRQGSSRAKKDCRLQVGKSVSRCRQDRERELRLRIEVLHKSCHGEIQWQ